jgi:hypothetical protein
VVFDFTIGDGRKARIHMLANLQEFGELDLEVLDSLMTAIGFNAVPVAASLVRRRTAHRTYAQP